MPELIARHPHQLPQRLAFVKQGEGVGNQVHFLASLMVGFVLLRHDLYYIIDIRYGIESDNNQHDITKYHLDGNMPALSLHPLPLHRDSDLPEDSDKFLVREVYSHLFIIDVVLEIIAKDIRHDFLAFQAERVQ